MKILSIISFLSFMQIGISLAQPLRPSLKADLYKHIVVGKVEEIRSTAIFDNRILSHQEVSAIAGDDKKKRGRIIYTGYITVTNSIKGSFEVGSKIPVTWTVRGTALAHGWVRPPGMCAVYHSSIAQGAILRFGLYRQTSDKLTWIFHEAALKNETKKSKKMQNKSQ